MVWSLITRKIFFNENDKNKLPQEKTHSAKEIYYTKCMEKERLWNLPGRLGKSEACRMNRHLAQELLGNECPGKVPSFAGNGGGKKW